MHGIEHFVGHGTVNRDFDKVLVGFTCPYRAPTVPTKWNSARWYRASGRPGDARFQRLRLKGTEDNEKGKATYGSASACLQKKWIRRFYLTY